MPDLPKIPRFDWFTPADAEKLKNLGPSAEVLRKVDLIARQLRPFSPKAEQARATLASLNRESPGETALREMIAAEQMALEAEKTTRGARIAALQADLQQAKHDRLDARDAFKAGAEYRGFLPPAMPPPPIEALAAPPLIEALAVQPLGVPRPSPAPGASLADLPPAKPREATPRAEAPDPPSPRNQQSALALKLMRQLYPPDGYAPKTVTPSALHRRMTVSVEDENKRSGGHLVAPSVSTIARVRPRR